MLTRRFHPKPLTLVSLGLAASCVTPIQAFRVPVLQAPTHDASLQGPRVPSQPQYWSAVAFFEHRNLPHWHKGDVACDGADHWYCPGDRVLVNADVSIPSKNKSINTTLPLFLVSDGLVESQIGVDLLKKFPIISDARSKPTIRLNIRYIPNAQVLEKARGILRAATDAATALASEVPSVEVALKVAGSVNKVLTGALEETEQVKPSSVTTTVDLEEHSALQPDGKFMQAFILAPAPKINKSEYQTTRPMYPCADLSGALCYSSKGEQSSFEYISSRVHDLVYLTITYQPYETVYDTMALLDSPSAACEELTKEELSAARAYLASNAAIFTPEDAALARRTIALGERYLDARETLFRHDYAHLLDLAFEVEALRPSWQRHRDLPGSALVLMTQELKMATSERDSAASPVRISRIAQAEQRMRECLRSFWSLNPARDILNAYDAFNFPERHCAEGRGSSDATDSATTQKSGAGSSNACLIASYGAALQKFCDLSGLNIDNVLAGGESAILERGVIIPVIYQSLRALLEGQSALADAKVAQLDKKTCENEDAFRKLLEDTSPFCSKCRKALSQRCVALKAEPEVVAHVMSADINKRASQLQETLSGSSSPPLEK